MLSIICARPTDDIEAFDSSHCCLGFFFPKGVRVPLITWGGAALMRHGGLTLTKSLSICKGGGAAAFEGE